MKIDHIEFLVGNARQTADWLMQKFDFKCTAYAGPETGMPNKEVAYVLEQGNIKFLIKSSLDHMSNISEHVDLHGDSVRDIAFNVEECCSIYNNIVNKGGIDVRPPMVLEDEYGCIIEAEIGTYGNTVHSIVNTEYYKGLFAPNYRAHKHRFYGAKIGLTNIDHIVGNVDKGRLNYWVDYYKRVFGFKEMMHFSEGDISTEYSSLRSTVMWDGIGNIVLPLNEPADGLRKSQIQEFLDYNNGPGVQHIALRTNNIISDVNEMRYRGVSFLNIPDSYYDECFKRVNIPELPWDKLQNLGILVDKDEQGYLLQIFTENFSDRPTLFFEIIQRVGSRGFGAGNFKALFQAIEKQQEKRGNL